MGRSDHTWLMIFLTNHWTIDSTKFNTINNIRKYTGNDTKTTDFAREYRIQLMIRSMCRRNITIDRTIFIFAFYGGGNHETFYFPLSVDDVKMFSLSARTLRQVDATGSRCSTPPWQPRNFNGKKKIIYLVREYKYNITITCRRNVDGRDNIRLV